MIRSTAELSVRPSDPLTKEELDFLWQEVASHEYYDPDLRRIAVMTAHLIKEVARARGDADYAPADSP